MEVKVVRRVLEANDLIAAQNRQLLAERGVYLLNLMGGPGAGKTSLLERTIEALKGRYRLGVIEGDIATTRDADRIAAHGVPTVQINTGGACHLDGSMLREALGQLDLEGLDAVLVENVGNLVCPAEFALGEDDRAMVLSAAEGDDKPLKYPLMFQVCSALVLNKVDLLPQLDFDLTAFRADARRVNPNLALFEVSCRSGQGMEGWLRWLEARIEAKRAR